MSESSQLGRSLKGDPDWELEFRLIWGFERSFDWQGRTPRRSSRSGCCRRLGDD